MLAPCTLLMGLAVGNLEAHFVMKVADVPVAHMTVSVHDDIYTYRVRRFFEETQPSDIVLSLKDGPKPEVLAFIERRNLGCGRVREERSGEIEQLCVEKSTKRIMRGTLARQSFTANYDAAGALKDIVVGDAHWVAVAAPIPNPTVNPFAEGLEVPEGPLELQPPFPHARWLSQPPIGTAQPQDVGQRRCLEVAREVVAHTPGAALAVGLVVDRGRAYPHAWVTTAHGPEDPSVLPDDDALQMRRYLEVPVTQSGNFFLKFWNGAFKLHPVGK